MVKKLVVFLVLTLELFSDDIYTRNCIECHKYLPTTLQQMFKEYLQTYSGEENVKAGLKHYLKYPSKSISVMSKLFIDSYGIKKRSHLNNKELDDAIKIYWEKFKVFGKLK